MHQSAKTLYIISKICLNLNPLILAVILYLCENLWKRCCESQLSILPFVSQRTNRCRGKKLELLITPTLSEWTREARFCGISNSHISYIPVCYYRLIRFHTNFRNQNFWKNLDTKIISFSKAAFPKSINIWNNVRGQ